MLLLLGKYIFCIDFYKYRISENTLIIDLDFINRN